MQHAQHVHLAHLALDAMTIGVIVTDRLGRIVFINAAAERLLDRPGAALGRSVGRLFATDPWNKTAFAALVANPAHVGGADHHVLMPAADVDTPDLSVRVMPVPGEPAQTMIFVREIERACDLETEAKRLFGLTKMEAKIASSLASGLSLAEAAAACEVGVSTARAHLSRVFHKTGTRQQSQVAALLRSAQIPVTIPAVRFSASGSTPDPLSQNRRRA